MKHQQKGFLKIIVLVVVALIVLGYYGIDVRKVVDSPLVKKNLEYGTQLAASGYEYLLEKIKN